MTLYGLSAISYDIKDEREYGRHGSCDWPVGNPFGGDLTCARNGFGHYIRLCTQHQKKFMAELISQLITNPDMECSLAIAEWMRGALSDSEADWWTDEQRKEQEQARKAANAVLGFLVETGDFDAFPPGIQRRIDDRMNRLIDQRFNEEWSA